MGLTSSLPIKADEGDDGWPHDPDSELSTGENATRASAGNGSLRRNSQGFQLRSNHSFDYSSEATGLSSDSAREQMGIAVQYLTEENVQLRSANQRLSRELEKERLYDSESYDPDEIYGESVENKLSRLEKHLASERREKWSAIEANEKTRVNLINCERDLAASNKLVETLSKELEACKAQVERLETAQNKASSSVTKDEETSPATSTSRSECLTEFRADLRSKREARQRALSAISAEMNGLREELQKERAVRRKLERELETRKRDFTDISLESVISDNNSLRNEVDILTENAEKLKDVASENIKLKFEAKRLNAEMDSLNLNLGELKFEYYEEKRKHERTKRMLKEEMEKNRTESDNQAQFRTEWEEERERFYEKYDQEKEEIIKRTNALKEVISITRQMLTIRETQVQELKVQLKEIEESVKKTKIVEESGLKAEYKKQLENIRNLKALYEERVHLMESERQKLDQNLADKAKIIQENGMEIEKLKSELETSRQETKLEREEYETLDREFRLMVARCKDLENELSLINNLFTQMLLGPFNTGNETDLDKLTELLQENHDLLAEMTTKEDSSEIASVLPKLLLDLITQVDGVSVERMKEYDMTESCETISEQSESLLEGNLGAVLPIVSFKDATLFKPPAEPPKASTNEPGPGSETKASENTCPAVQEIASNLPKVWKVLMELLSHHSAPEEPAIRDDEKQCYKKVDTPNGPRTVISVSKTFIRLKDLILEKKALQKELTRLKQLNSHLETRLDDQEKRLSQVQCELHKTWGIVGRMRAQHQQLHNHEKILRYELQEKRVMLSELKQELEYCRDKWERARQKNDDTETEWKKLRREFAARKTKGYSSPTLNDSGESGFSDEHNESGEDCDADRSSTQSPVDLKLLGDQEEVDSTNIPVPLNKDETFPKETEEPRLPNTPEEDDVRNEETSKKTQSTSIANLERVFKAEESKEEARREIDEFAASTSKFEEISSPSTSAQAISQNSADDRDRAREARDMRLKRLEEQCKLLVRQVDITSHKSNFLNNRLEELHEQYGSSEDQSRPGPPPGPSLVTRTLSETSEESPEETHREENPEPNEKQGGNSAKTE